MEELNWCPTLHHSEHSEAMQASPGSGFASSLRSSQRLTWTSASHIFGVIAAKNGRSSIPETAMEIKPRCTECLAQTRG